jgi:predicted secreted protein
MSLVSAVVVYFLIWWVVLFTILPIGTRPDPESDAESGWRGTPQAPRLWRKALITTLVSGVIFAGVYLWISSDFMSFRSGWWSMPEK